MCDSWVNKNTCIATCPPECDSIGAQWISVHMRCQCIAALTGPSCLAVSQFCSDVIYMWGPCNWWAEQGVNRQSSRCVQPFVGCPMTGWAPVYIHTASRRRGRAHTVNSAGKNRHGLTWVVQLEDRFIRRGKYWGLIKPDTLRQQKRHRSYRCSDIQVCVWDLCRAEGCVTSMRQAFASSI